MSRISLLILLLLLTLACYAKITLVGGGKSVYSIVLPAAPAPAERYAAEELQRYVAKISGVTLPIVDEKGGAGETVILLGQTAATRALGIDPAREKLGEEDYLLRTVGKRLLIVGGGPRGSLYGVYELLEGTLDVRWLAPDVEIVPATARINLPELNVTHRPVFEYRDIYWDGPLHDPVFAARHRINGQQVGGLKDPKFGGFGGYYAPGYCHTLDELVPRSLYATHPEYFPLINGKRVNGYVQRCFANPDVLRITLENIRKALKEHPEANIVSVTQNDTGNWCQCPECKALDDAEGSPSASLIKFVNAVAADLEKDYPHVLIDTFAYQYTRKPPKTLRPHKNVVIRLCSIECCFAHSLATCPSEQNARFRADAAIWQPIAPRLYVWDYTTNFANYQQPFPNFDTLQANIQYFSRLGVKGLFEQGNCTPGGELGPLRSYLLLELMWNPAADVKALTRDFLQGYYGKAAPAMQQYLDAIHRPARELGVHAFIYDKFTAPYLTDTILAEATRALDSAEHLADTDAIRQRVQAARIPVQYVNFMTNRFPTETKSAVCKALIAAMRRCGITHVAEQLLLKDWAKRMGEE